VIGSIALLAVSFVVLLAGAYIFTNAVEWAGVRLNLGHGAVGSVLAAVATAMPESLIPVVAIVSGEQTGEIAIGAIIGAPFLLGTLAMALIGVSAVGFRRRRGRRRLDIDRRSVLRDLSVFLVFFTVAVLLGLVGSKVVHIIGGIVLVAAYVGYLWRTISSHREEGGEGQPGRLFFDPSKGDPPRNLQIIAQVVASLAMIVGGAHLFVTEIEALAHDLGIAALVLALVLAPLASELPEKLNSVLWVRQAKDTLAVGNVTGAMVYQSMLPVAVGLAFTPWKLTGPAVAASLAALAGGALAVAVVLRGGRLRMPYVGTWFALYGGAVGFILVAQ
jgi:cation:H+ antiporter